MSASTVSTFQSFPAPGSIPPVTFYNIQGLANWLNLNPIYKLNFSYTGTFPFLYPPYYSSVISTIEYNPQNVPLAATVTTLSQHQALQYNAQIQIFRNVYATNSNAYVNYIATGQNPIYYKFLTYKDMTNYNSAVQLINKLYPFKDMAVAAKWIIPFPLFM